LLLQKQYKYPALPYVVPNSRKQGTEVPLVCNIKIEMDTARVTLNYPTKDKVRYVVLYGAINTAKLDVIPRYILDKIAFKEKRDTINISIPKNYLEKNSCAITFIDFLETKASQLLLVLHRNENHKSALKMKTDNRPWYWIPILSFASGLPYAIIISVSVIMYKNLGINMKILVFIQVYFTTSWVIKPLWSPFIDLYSTKENGFLAMQLIIAVDFNC
jgi:hypothetical protein